MFVKSQFGRFRQKLDEGIRLEAVHLRIGTLVHILLDVFPIYRIHMADVHIRVGLEACAVDHFKSGELFLFLLRDCIWMIRSWRDWEEPPSAIDMSPSRPRVYVNESFAVEGCYLFM